MDWEHVGEATLSDGHVTLPSMPSEPGIYQWIFTHDGQARHYVGEAHNLSKRFDGYRTPGRTRSTNLRMRARAERVISSGGTVEILRATRIRLVVDGRTVEHPDLASEFARCFIENAALVSLLASDRTVVNGKGYGAFRPDGVLD